MEGLITILVLLAVLYVLILFAWKNFVRGKWSGADQSFFKKNWTRIKAEQDLRMRIMEADKLFDSMTKKKGMSGTVGEKLKRNAGKFSDIQGLWRAHKLRNRLAHEMDFKMNGSHANEAMKSFGKAFKDLGLLE